MTNVLDTVEPAPPRGLTIQVTRSVADQVVVENTTSEDLEVFAEDGEAFLRIGPRGVEANFSSPDWYRSNTPEGAAPVPAAALANLPPRWERVSEGTAWGWFDHRLHRGPVTRVPAAVPGESVTLERWVIPMRHGGKPLRAAGRRLYSRPAGTFRHEVVAQIPRTQAAVLAGKVPAVFLRVEEPVDELVLLGEGGEPFVRFGRRGVEVNTISPTWALTARSRGTFDPSPLAISGHQPRWEREGSAHQLTWLEPRAVPRSDGANFEWMVSGRLDGEDVALRGRSVWEPNGGDADHAAGSEDALGDWRPAAAAGGLALLAVGGAAVAVRRRAQPAAPNGGS